MNPSSAEDKSAPVKKRCSINRLQCALLVFLFVAMAITIGVLVSFVVKKDECPEPTSPAPEPSEPENPWEYHRLPQYVFPDHYDLTLYPDFYDGHDTFTGNVTITLNVTKATQHLLIHIRDLTVTRTRLTRAGNDVTIARTFHYEENEYWVVEAADVISPGSVKVELQFEGSLSNGIVGLYKSVYVNSLTNETRYLATSKFQPTDARKAFPCLDEPGFKSTYNTTLIHRPGLVALSNMPVESTSQYGGHLVATRFQKSVRMVSYLTCFIVCDFQYTEINITRNGSIIPFRVYATPDKVNQTRYALDIGVRILKRYESYYGLPYPLPKMDMIAIPDFVSGAMEHWGLVTYRETNLLYDERDASLVNKERVAAVVAHELAHMWFGNLVTMKWWDDLWLNEGFASYVEYLGIDTVEPTWDMKSQFVPTDLQRVMPDDSKLSSHPIVVPVNHPSEITEVFDSISYSKGASVLRMLNTFMGDDSFLTGLQAYMKKYEFQTTVTDDLWRALEQVPGAPPVKAIMDTWTRQMGFPVVKVTINGRSVTLTQERFLLDPKADKTQPPSDYNYKWHIPITYKTNEENSSSIFWLKDTKATLTTSTDLTHGWIKLNIDQQGYYRVKYPDSMWRKLTEVLKNNTQSLSPGDRSGLIDDVFNLANADMLDISLALDLISYMDREQHLVPWTTVSGRLNFISQMMATGTEYSKWQRFVRNIASPVLQRIGYVDNGTDLERQLRELVITLACNHGDRDCLSNMTSMFRDRLSGSSIAPNIRNPVYRFGMRMSGDEEAWDYMWAEYNRAVVPQERRRLLYAVTQTSVPWLIHRLLEYSLDTSKVREQDFFIMMSYVSSNPVAHPIVWDFARANWLALVDRFGITNRYLGRLVPGIVNYFNTKQQLQEVEDFFKKYPEAGAGARAREQALEQIRSNIAWMDGNESKIKDWLNS